MTQTAEATLETNRGKMTPSQIVSELTYSCYAFNRRNSPHITPEEWARIFGPSATAAMEERFRKEREVEVVANAAPTPSYNPDALVDYYERRGGCYDE